jgi:bifunctional DNA-binding transcriptional regulator/antitoxin component of YhaV-PrlF toxin-antitoxin module
MGTAKSAVAEIKARGQLTIPKKMREISNMDEGSVVSIIPIGDSLFITPKRLELDEARRQLTRLLKASGLSMEKLIDGLKEERNELYKETYGTKRKV